MYYSSGRTFWICCSALGAALPDRWFELLDMPFVPQLAFLVDGIGVMPYYSTPDFLFCRYVYADTPDRTFYQFLPLFVVFAQLIAR